MSFAICVILDVLTLSIIFVLVKGKGFNHNETFWGLYCVLCTINEPGHKKTNILHMRKQRRRSASQ